MVQLGLLHFLATAIGVVLVGATDSQRPHVGPQAVNLWRLEDEPRRHQDEPPSGSSQQSVFTNEGKKNKYAEFPEQWFEQPLDHFSSSSPDALSGPTFPQRYWVNKRHYKPGGPVIVLDSGETSGYNRLLFLDTGIVDILARETDGLGVVLEHRYYGKSIPVANLSTDSLRWLNNAQSAADSARFMAKVKFDAVGVEEDLTAPKTPWIYYGGSYAGARAAHMRILYPNLVYAAIASSGVTHATLENWEYHDVIRQAADKNCSELLQASIAVIDAALSIPLPVTKKFVKGLFGLAELEHDDDFASIIEAPLGAWQSKNWDPALNSRRFEEFCEALKKPLKEKELDGKGLEAKDTVIKGPGGFEIPLAILNYGKYIQERYVSKCKTTVEDCFGTYGDPEAFRNTSLSQEWRLWTFQVCTEWGYFTAAPPDPKHPRIVSKYLTLNVTSRICELAFPPGEHFSVPLLPNVSSVNALGDFGIGADRLAIIDGEVDPWRPNTPHSSSSAPEREDTVLRPFKLIPGGVHHYDEYGLADITKEPKEILKIHLEMIGFVKAWLEDWEKQMEVRV